MRAVGSFSLRGRREPCGQQFTRPLAHAHPPPAGMPVASWLPGVVDQLDPMRRTTMPTEDRGSGVTGAVREMAPALSGNPAAVWHAARYGTEELAEALP